MNKLFLRGSLATNADIDAVAKTHEAFEANDPDFRRRLALLREAIAMAAARCIRQLPENTEFEKDATVDRYHLVHLLVAMLIKVRIFKTDVSTVDESYFNWACALAPGSGIAQCWSHPVFARLDDPSKHPTIAVNGDHVTAELRHESKRKLAADLRNLGLADISKQWRCSMRNTRVWVLSDDVLNEISESADKESC